MHYLRLRSINVLTSQRGEHDIENQIIFQGNPGFIFHDSRGFEAGGARELKLVQQFIEKRSKARNVHNQLHAIWCVCTCLYRPINFLDAGGKKLFWVGTAFQLVMIDQLLPQRRNFSMSVGRELVCASLSKYFTVNDDPPAKYR